VVVLSDFQTKLPQQLSTVPKRSGAYIGNAWQSPAQHEQISVRKLSIHFEVWRVQAAHVKAI